MLWMIRCFFFFDRKSELNWLILKRGTVKKLTRVSLNSHVRP